MNYIRSYAREITFTALIKFNALLYSTAQLNGSKRSSKSCSTLHELQCTQYNTQLNTTSTALAVGSEK